MVGNDNVSKRGPDKDGEEPTLTKTNHGDDDTRRSGSNSRYNDRDRQHEQRYRQTQNYPRDNGQHSRRGNSPVQGRIRGGDVRCGGGRNLSQTSSPSSSSRSSPNKGFDGRRNYHRSNQWDHSDRNRARPPHHNHQDHRDRGHHSTNTNNNSTTVRNYSDSKQSFGASNNRHPFRSGCNNITDSDNSHVIPPTRRSRSRSRTRDDRDKGRPNNLKTDYRRGRSPIINVRRSRSKSPHTGRSRGPSSRSSSRSSRSRSSSHRDRRSPSSMSVRSGNMKNNLEREDTTRHQPPVPSTATQEGVPSVPSGSGAVALQNPAVGSALSSEELSAPFSLARSSPSNRGRGFRHNVRNGSDADLQAHGRGNFHHRGEGGTNSFQKRAFPPFSKAQVYGEQRLTGTNNSNNHSSNKANVEQVSRPARNPLRNSTRHNNKPRRGRGAAHHVPRRNNMLPEQDSTNRKRKSRPSSLDSDAFSPSTGSFRLSHSMSKTMKLSPTLSAGSCSDQHQLSNPAFMSNPTTSKIDFLNDLDFLGNGNNADDYKELAEVAKWVRSTPDEIHYTREVDGRATATARTQDLCQKFEATLLYKSKLAREEAEALGDIRMAELIKIELAQIAEQKELRKQKKLKKKCCPGLTEDPEKINNSMNNDNSNHTHGSCCQTSMDGGNSGTKSCSSPCPTNNKADNAIVTAEDSTKADSEVPAKSNIFPPLPPSERSIEEPIHELPVPPPPPHMPEKQKEEESMEEGELADSAEEDDQHAPTPPTAPLPKDDHPKPPPPPPLPKNEGNIDPKPKPPPPSPPTKNKPNAKSAKHETSKEKRKDAKKNSGKAGNNQKKITKKGKYNSSSEEENGEENDQNADSSSSNSEDDSDSDSSSSSTSSSDNEDGCGLSMTRSDSANRELERRKKHPRRLHDELWHNDPGLMNDGPVCRCSAKARRYGIRHGFYPGEEKIEHCDHFSNNKTRLYHYRITISPAKNFLISTPTVINHDGHEYIFEGFSIFSHYKVDLTLPPCKVIRFNIRYDVFVTDEKFPESFCVKELLLFETYLFREILELVDLKYDWNEETGCSPFHLMPRFVRQLPDNGQEVLSMSRVLIHLLKSDRQLVKEEDLAKLYTVEQSDWQNFADKHKGTIVTKWGMKPCAVRVDQIDRDVSGQEVVEEDGIPFPLIVHFGIRPPQLSYAGNAGYQRAWRRYVKYRHLLSNMPKPSAEDKLKLLKKEMKLQAMRTASNMKRDVTVAISSRGFRTTGICCDLVQHAMLIPVLVAHLRFHKCLQTLETSMAYPFQHRYLLQLAMTHPSYRENFGTNPDHARNALTNCGIRQPEYGDRRIHYASTRKRGINTLINIMAKFGADQETESEITHNERLEFLGDAVVEFVTSIHLFHIFPDLEEGGLATYRAAIVQNQHLAVLAQTLNLDQYMLYAHGSDLCHDSELRHAMANCFEALMGALFLDGGIEAADRVFGNTLFGTDDLLLDMWANYPKHPLQQEEPNGDRHWVKDYDVLKKLVDFEDSIGVTFNHIRLLARAFTDRSLGYNNLTRGSNQRLEFLGDTVLQLISSEHLYRHFPDHHEGHLSLLRSSLVNNRTQSLVCDDLDMPQYAMRGDPKSEMKTKDRADLLEAFLGALYIDKGLRCCHLFCQVCFFPRLCKSITKQEWNDPKSKLQQCCLTLRAMDGREPDIPVYKVTESLGPTNTRTYIVAVYFRGERLATAQGHSIQEAEMNAADQALKVSGHLFPQLHHQKRIMDKTKIIGDTEVVGCSASASTSSGDNSEMMYGLDFDNKKFQYQSN